MKKSRHQNGTRFKKLDNTVGEGFNSSNLLKDYKRQTLRKKVKDNLTSREKGLNAFYLKVEEL